MTQFDATNAITASFFFVGALVADAMTAVEKATNAPASLRATSLVLVAMFASPAITRPSIGIHGWLQRPVLTVLLFCAALLGMHTGGDMTRAFDAVFITLVCAAIVGLFYLGGVDETTKSQRAGKAVDAHTSTSSCMLTGALMLYSNLRILRAGIRHPYEVREFGVPVMNSTSFVRGYAHASDLATAATTFGGAIGIGASFVMVVHVQTLARGTGAIALQLGVTGVFQLLSAFAATLSTASQITELPVLFASTACRDASIACEAAAMSRRFASTNTASIGLWLSAIGMLALAYPPSVRMIKPAEWFSWSGWGDWTNRYQRDNAPRAMWAISGFVFSFAAALVAFILIWTNSRFENTTDLMLLLSLISVLWSAYFDTWTGSLLYLVSFVWYEVVYVEAYGIKTALSHLTHVSLYFNAVLLILHMTLVTVMLCYFNENIARFTGGVAIAGASIATGLYTASCCLVMGAGGDYSQILDVSNGPETVSTFIHQHFVPLLVWVPLFTCRCETNLVDRTVRAVAWLFSAPFVLTAYAVVLAALRTGPPSITLFAPWAMFGCILGSGVVPWAAASVV